MPSELVRRRGGRDNRARFQMSGVLLGVEATVDDRTCRHVSNYRQ